MSSRQAQQPISAPDERYRLYLATSLALALGLGFVLALLLALALAFEASWGLRWQALAQVHGQIQLLGFAGCFVAGMAFRLVPRFSGTPLQHAWVVLPTYVLLLTGLLVRALSQPLSDSGAFTWGPALSGWCLAGASLLFCLAILPTLVRPLRGRQPWAAFVAAGAVWFAVQGVLDAWFLSDLSLHGSALNALPGGRTVVPLSRDAMLLTIQLYGFLLCFIFGVAGRAIPVFFAYKVPSALPAVAWSALQLGIVLVVGAAVAASSVPELAVWGEAAGLACLGAGLIVAAAWSGCWRPASRLRPSARPAAPLLRTAYLSCALAGVLCIVFALRDLIEDERLPGNDADALRHLLALGMITVFIVAMAHLVEPGLASQRFTGVRARWRLPAIHVLLVLAVVLRVVPPLLADLGARIEFSFISVAGILAWVAVALFAQGLWLARPSAAPAVERGATPHQYP